jgi:hypothetical protein
MNKLNLQGKVLLAPLGGLLILVIVFAIVQNQALRKLSTPQLIERAYTRGIISEEQRLLYLAYAVFDYKSLPVRFRGNIGWRGTFIVAELYKAANTPSVLCSMSSYVRSEFQRVIHPEITCD